MKHVKIKTFIIYVILYISYILLYIFIYNILYDKACLKKIKVAKQGAPEPGNTRLQGFLCR